jgi:hypothetical protein
MKSYLSLILCAAVVCFSACSKDTVEPRFGSPSTSETPFEPTEESPASVVDGTKTLQQDQVSPDVNPTSTTTRGEIGITDLGIPGLNLGDIVKNKIELNSDVPGNEPSYSWAVAEGVMIICEATETTIFDENVRVISIELASPFAGKTDLGVGIGSSKALVITSYGEPSSSNEKGDKYGKMTIKYNNDNVVEAIYFRN